MECSLTLPSERASLLSCCPSLPTFSLLLGIIHTLTFDWWLAQAAALDSNCLAMLAELMGRTSQLDTIEYLMAGMWILLRTPANRALLSTAFDPSKSSTAR